MAYVVLQGFTQRIERHSVEMVKCVVLDSAINEARQLAKKGKGNIYCVLDTGLADVQVRGWADGVTFRWCKQCKKCQGKGTLGEAWNMTSCSTCNSWGMVEDT